MTDHHPPTAPTENADSQANDPPPRALIACFALDQHEAGALLVASTLRDAGAEVIYVGRFGLPASILRAALEEDVDVIGISCHSWEYLSYTPELLQLMADEDCDARVVLGGSVITDEDARALIAAGVHTVVGPGASQSDVVASVWSATAERRAAGQRPESQSGLAGGDLVVDFNELAQQRRKGNLTNEL